MSHTTANTIARSLYDPYQSISRCNVVANRFTGRMFLGRREAYPSNQDIQNFSRHPNARNESLGTGCTKGFSDVENYEENAYKMTNSITVFYALKIAQKFKIS